MVMLQPAGREEHGKKIPKCCAKWEGPHLRHMESCTLGEDPPSPQPSQKQWRHPSILSDEPPDSLTSLLSLISFKIIFSQKIKGGNPGVASQHVPCAHKTSAEAPVLISDREEITQRLLTITRVTWSFG